MKIAALTIVASLVASAASAEGATYIGAAADLLPGFGRNTAEITPMVSGTTS